MIRSTLRGSAARALSARAIAPVSRCARYSTPAAERYWTDCPPAGAVAATEAATSPQIEGSLPPSDAATRLAGLLQVLSHEIQHVLPVQAEHAAGAGAIAVEPERRHAGDHVARAEVVRPARVAEAGAARRGVVREQQGEGAGEPRVDLDEVRLREHADALRLDVHRVDLLQPVAHRREHRRATWLQRVELARDGERSVLAGGELHGLGEQDDPHVVQKEQVLGEERMGVPGGGL